MMKGWLLYFLLLLGPIEYARAFAFGFGGWKSSLKTRRFRFGPSSTTVRKRRAPHHFSSAIIISNQDDPNDDGQPSTPLPLQSKHNDDAIDRFVSRLEDSLLLKDDLSSSSSSSCSFESFTLFGPSKKHVASFLAARAAEASSKAADNNHVNAAEDAENMVRGCIRRVDGRRVVLTKKKKKKGGRSTQHTATSSNADQQQTIIMMQVTFKYILATDIVKNWSLNEEVIAPYVRSLLKYGHTGTREESSEWDSLKADEPQQRQKEQQGLAIQRAVLETTESTIKVVNINSNKKKPRLLEKKKKKTENAASSSSIASSSSFLAHDRIKQVPLPLAASAAANNGAVTDFWQALGLTNAQGQPRGGALNNKGKSKIRQAQKFVEIVSRLVDSAAVDGSCTRPIRGISIVDMGCGRGYLTFALHSFLTQKYAAVSAARIESSERNDKMDATNDNNNAITMVQSRGIDVRPKLVGEISGIARSLGPDFDHLSFAQGTIQDFVREKNSRNDQRHHDDHSVFKWSSSFNNTDMLEMTTRNEGEQHDDSTLKVLIALHACDTATDDALWAAIEGQADIIVVAPCCHKQARPQIDRHYYSSQKRQQQQQQQGEEEHDIASMLMGDVLRHNIYRERMTETVTDAMRALLLELAGYTPVKVFEFVGGEHTSKNVMITAMKGRRQPSLQQKEQLLRRLRTLADFYGVHEQKLATWMGISLVGEGQQDSYIHSVKKSTFPQPPLSARNMPPL